MNFFFTILLSVVVIYLGYYFNMLWVSVLISIILFVMLSGAPKPQPRAKEVAAAKAQEMTLSRGGNKGNPLYIQTVPPRDTAGETIAKVTGSFLGYMVRFIIAGAKALLGIEKKK